MIDFDDLEEELEQRDTDLENLATQNTLDHEAAERARLAEEATARSVRICAGLRVQNLKTGRTGIVLRAAVGTPSDFRLRYDNGDERVQPVANFETENGQPLLEASAEEAARLQAEEAEEVEPRKEAKQKAIETAPVARRAAVGGGTDRERFIAFEHTEETAFWAMPEEQWWYYPKAGLGERPQNMKQFKEAVIKDNPGEFWNIKFPRSPEELRAMGPAWLTKAMHTAGTLPKDNEVVKFTKFQVKAGDVTKEGTADENMWGGAGCKVLMSVEYKNGPGGLTEGMFVKMPHEFTGKNERYKNSITLANMDWSEVMFLNLLAGKTPVRTPRCYFADMNRATTNSIIIMETIPYAEPETRDVGPGEFFPAAGKYRDWAIPDPVELYYAHAKGLGQFCAYYKQISANTEQVDLCFQEEGPFRYRQGLYYHTGNHTWADRDSMFLGLLQDNWGFAQACGFPPNVATGFVQLGHDFCLKVAPQFFPEDLVSKKFSDKVFNEMHEMAHYLAEFGFYTNMMPEYWSLGHPNAQIDNAFFWRDYSGVVMAGLTDFGSMGHLPMPTMLSGGWCGAEPEMMDEHEDKLVKVFLAEYEKAGGIHLDFEDFFLHLKLGQATTFAGCCANLGGMYRIMPKAEWKNVNSRFDPKIDNTFLIRCYSVQVIFLLALWRKRNPYPYFLRWLKRVGMPKKELTKWM